MVVAVFWVVVPVTALVLRVHGLCHNKRGRSVDIPLHS